MMPGMSGPVISALPDWLTSSLIYLSAAVVAVPLALSLIHISMCIRDSAWAAFAFWAHGLLIGVRPFGV